MSRLCENCRSTIEMNTVYCPVCGKRLEPNNQKKEHKNFFINILSFIHLFISAFFDPISFYRKNTTFPLYTYFVIPAAFYIFFFAGIISEKISLGYFGAGKAAIVFLLSILLSVFLYAVNISTIYYSAKFSTVDIDILKIIKAVGAGYFLPALLAFIGFILNISFKIAFLSISLTSLIATFVPYYIITSEINRKKDIMTYVPTIVVGLINMILVSLIYGLKF